jgi:hypothetical protein
LICLKIELQNAAAPSKPLLNIEKRFRVSIMRLGEREFPTPAISTTALWTPRLVSAGRRADLIDLRTRVPARPLWPCTSWPKLNEPVAWPPTDAEHAMDAEYPASCVNVDDMLIRNLIPASRPWRLPKLWFDPTALM